MTNPSHHHSKSSVNIRELVLDILLEVPSHYSHIVIRQTLSKYQYLEKRDRAFITRLAEGTLEQMLHLDYIIDLFSKVKVSKQKPVIKNILRMAVYQMKFMDSVPVSAACNEAVKLAEKRGFYNLKGFVNGVLRNISRNLDQIGYHDLKANPIKYYSIMYSTPEWIIENWSKTYSYDIIEIMLKTFLEDKKTTVRCIVNQISKEEIIMLLKAEGVMAEEHPLYNNALDISGYDYLDYLDTFSKGFITVQDITSMTVSKAADPKPGDYVIDVCAAPGGKSIHIAELLNQTGMVEARDISASKISLIEENILRTGIGNIKTVVMDATQYDEASYEKADIVIADLPCSGLGVMGNKTDIKYKMTKEKQIDLVMLQKEILSVINKYVKTGGTLIYSTCTINIEENEKMIEWFTKCFPYSLESIDEYVPECFRSDTTADGYLQFIPGIHGPTGFFIAKLVKQTGG